jgi:hypothetical protein
MQLQRIEGVVSPISSKQLLKRHESIHSAQQMQHKHPAQFSTLDQADPRKRPDLPKQKKPN